MLTYQVRARGLYTEPLGQKPPFPCSVTIALTFAPAMPFGGPVAPGRTAVLGETASMRFDSNTGRCLAESAVPLQPVDACISMNDGEIRFERETCRITFACDSRQELQSVLEKYHYLLPIVMNVDFPDAPVVCEVTGNAGGVDFCWGILDPGPAAMYATTTADQEDKLAAAIRRVRLLDGRGPSGRKRLTAALHWFHVACRLERVGNAPWEFLGEILLNLAKILEVLFPAANGRTLEAARAGLASLGFTTEQAEAWYVPALALRNKIDVAHISLATFAQKDLEVIHQWAGGAECRFRVLLGRILGGVAAGTWELPEYTDDGPSADALDVVARLRASVTQTENAG